jgi:hypothetical protein
MFTTELQPLITALASGDTAAAKDEEIKILRRLIEDFTDETLDPNEEYNTGYPGLRGDIRDRVEMLDMVLGR